MGKGASKAAHASNQRAGLSRKSGTLMFLERTRHIGVVVIHLEFADNRAAELTPLVRQATCSNDEGAVQISLSRAEEREYEAHRNCERRQHGTVDLSRERRG